MTPADKMRTAAAHLREDAATAAAWTEYPQPKAANDA